MIKMNFSLTKEPPPRNFKLADADIATLLRGLESGQFTSEELVKAYIARIHHVQPKVHAISEVNPDALAIARERDLERAHGQSQGLLHGLPILVKDIFVGNRRVTTEVGFSGFEGTSFNYEATVLRRLREAGAIVHAHTSMTEFPIRASGRAPNGWAPVTGQSLGIFCEKQDPGGSSTGSGIGAALGLGAAALGTETSGSIASPARTCGVVGLKPTSGLVSRFGVFTGTPWQDSVGVLSRSVLDAAYILTATSGLDKNDSFHHVDDPRDKDNKFHRPADGTDFRQYCQGSSLEGLRIAVPRHIIKKKPFVADKFEEALDVLRSLGATIVNNAVFPKYSLELLARHKDIWNVSLLVDYRNSMNHFLKAMTTNPQELKSIEDVIKYVKETPQERFEDYGAAYLESASELGRQFDTDPRAYEESKELRLKMGMEVGKLLDKYDCHLLATPSWTDTTADIGGNPQISLPLPALPKEFPLKLRGNGMVADGPNIPTSMLVIARRWDDGTALRAAHVFEQATQYRKKFKPIVQCDIELDHGKSAV